MNFPALIIEVPHQRRAEAYPIFDRADFARVYGNQVSEWLDRQAELEGENPRVECAPENDVCWLKAIGHDLHTVITIESADEASDWMSLRNVHQSARIAALVSEHAPTLWDELDNNKEHTNA